MSSRFSFLILIAVLFALASCKNNDEVFKTVQPAYINVVNASTDTLNFYLNGTRQNNSSSIYPGGQSLYLTVPSGAQNYQFKKAGGFAALFSVPLTLKDSASYSLYVYGESADKTFSTFDQLLTYTAHPDTTQVRFVNISPDAGNLNVNVGDSVSFTSVPFKTSTAFSLLEYGQKEIKVFQSGSATPLKDTVVTLQEGYIYTLISKGLLNGKGNAAFNVALLINSE